MRRPSQAIKRERPHLTPKSQFQTSKKRTLSSSRQRKHLPLNWAMAKSGKKHVLGWPRRQRTSETHSFAFIMKSLNSTHT